jgi:transposase-like protein
MPWKDKTTMEQKIEFICEWLSGKYTISELCRHYEISRPTAYLLIGRYEKSSIEGLLEKTRAPRHHPNKTPKAVELKILRLKKQYSRWGAKKIYKLLFS